MLEEYTRISYIIYIDHAYIYIDVGVSIVVSLITCVCGVKVSLY